MSSPCASTMVLTMYRPRPTPSRSVERLLSVLWKRSKMSGSSSGAMVGPVLPTVVTALFPLRSTRMESVPPSSMNFTALSMRL